MQILKSYYTMSLSKFELFSKVKAEDISTAYATVDEQTRASFDVVLALVGRIHESKLKKTTSKKRSLHEMKQTDVNQAILAAITKFCDDTGSGMLFSPLKFQTFLLNSTV